MHQLRLISPMHVKFEGGLDLSFVRVSQKEHFNNAHELIAEQMCYIMIMSSPESLSNLVC